MLVRMRSSGFRPGSIWASEPVATSTFLACTCVALPSVPFDRSTVWTPPLAAPVRLPVPAMTVTLFFRIRKSRPLACLAMIWFLRSRMAFQFSVTSPTPSMPYSLACFRWSYTSALKSRDLVGMQPTVQAGAAQLRLPLDQRHLQSQLPCADRGGIPRRSASDHRHVISCLCQDFRSPSFRQHR